MKQKLFSILAAMAVLASCNPVEPVNPGNGDGNGGDETVALVAPQASVKDLGSDGLELSWTSAVPEGAKVGVSYTVYANLDGKDLYTNPQTYNAASALSYKLGAEALNELAAKLGAEAGSLVQLQFSVYAKADDADIETVVSNVVKASFQTIVEKPEVPDVLYLAGSATEAGWDISKAIPVRGVNGVYKAEEVTLNLTISDTGFKFYFTNDGSSDCFFGPDRSADVFGTAMLYKEDDGTANLFQPALNGYESGVYTITLDVNALMMTMVKTGEIEYQIELGDEVYPQGSCFPWGWSFNGPMPKVSDKVYAVKNVECHWGDNHDSGFKIFYANGVWSPYYAMTDDSTKDNIKLVLVTDSEAPQVYPGKLGYEDAYYDITADFNTMTLTLEKVGDIAGPNPPSGDFPDLYVIGGSFKDGDCWDIMESMKLVSDANGFYTSVSPIFFPKWCYFKFSTADYGKQYLRNVDGGWLDAKLKTSDADEVDGCNFVPGNYDYDWVDGYYTITLDVVNLKVTFAKANNGDGPTIDPNTAFYLFGGAFINGTEDWSFNDKNALVPVSENVYESAAPIQLGEWTYFKFEKQDWTEYVPDKNASDYWTVTRRTYDPDSNDGTFSIGNMGLKDGFYKVVLDLNSFKVTVTPAE